MSRKKSNAENFINNERIMLSAQNELFIFDASKF